MIALGLLEPGLAYLLGLWGLARIEATYATLIQSTEPTFILLVSAVGYGLRPSTRFVVLSLLVLPALAVALGVGPSGACSDLDILAVTALVLSTLIAAIFVVLAGRIAKDADPILATAGQHTAALVLAMSALGAQAMVDGSFALPRSWLSWAAAFGSGLLLYALPFSLFNAALRRLASHEAGVYVALIPVIAIGAGRLFLNERLGTLQLCGAASVIFLIGLISRRSNS